MARVTEGVQTRQGHSRVGNGSTAKSVLDGQGPTRLHDFGYDKPPNPDGTISYELIAMSHRVIGLRWMMVPPVLATLPASSGEHTSYGWTEGRVPGILRVASMVARSFMAISTTGGAYDHPIRMMEFDFCVFYVIVARGTVLIRGWSGGVP